MNSRYLFHPSNRNCSLFQPGIRARSRQSGLLTSLGFPSQVPPSVRLQFQAPVPPSSQRLFPPLLPRQTASRKDYASCQERWSFFNQFLYPSPSLVLCSVPDNDHRCLDMIVETGRRQSTHKSLSPSFLDHLVDGPPIPFFSRKGYGPVHPLITSPCRQKTRGPGQT